MTAEAHPIELDSFFGGVADPDATLVDANSGRRPINHLEAPTASIRPRRPAPAVARVEPQIPAERTCLGELVPSDACVPVAGAMLVAASVEEEMVEASTVSDFEEPALPPSVRGSERIPSIRSHSVARHGSSPWAASELDAAVGIRPLSNPGDRHALLSPAVAAPALASKVGIRARSAPGAVEFDSKDTVAPRAFGAESARGTGEETSAEAPVASDRAHPKTPAWAGQQTQVAGPGFWMEDEDAARDDGSAHVSRRSETVVKPQKSVGTSVSVETAATKARGAAPRRVLPHEALAFSLVLVAISLSTAAFVSAYL